MLFRKFILDLSLLTLFSVVVHAQSLPVNPAPKTAAEAYKNIKILKDAPAEQLIPAMQFISTSLGVGCDHCHVRGAFEKDDKQSKQTARKMMEMMVAINQNNFNGHRDVTCYSCHHGVSQPISIPVIAEEDIPPPTSSDTPPADLPNADKLIEKYIQALGNVADLHKLSSRVEKGKAIVLPGREFPTEMAYKAPDSVIATIHMPDGDLMTGRNQSGGWAVTPGRPVHDMSDAELDAARLDSTFYFPLHVKELFTEFKTTGVDKVGGRAVYVVTGRREKQPPVNFYLDQESGLPLRLVRYDETPVGRIPVQTDFSDYREVNGIKIPFTRITARPARRITIKIDQIEQNTAIDDSMFMKPTAATASGQPTTPK
jgi:photosynthetic reaction center cytochrome c subunit